jgi:hypothetical protein
MQKCFTEAFQQENNIRSESPKCGIFGYGKQFAHNIDTRAKDE